MVRLEQVALVTSVTQNRLGSILRSSELALEVGMGCMRDICP